MVISVSFTSDEENLKLDYAFDYDFAVIEWLRLKRDRQVHIQVVLLYYSYMPCSL